MNKVHFSGLKRNKIRLIIENGEHPIEIYNPTEEQRKQILKLLIENYDFEEKEMNLSDVDVIKVVIPMLTNIHLDIEDENLLTEIISDPSELLLDIQEELSVIVQEIASRFVNHLTSLNKLPDKSLEKMLEVKYLDKEKQDDN